MQSIHHLTYKNDGGTLAQEFGQYGSIDFTGACNDGATREVVSVAKNNASGANIGWKLVGNGLEFNTNMSASVTKHISVGGANTSRYENRLSAYIQSNSTISSVKITGPGLPSTRLFLKNSIGCDFLTIAPFRNDGVTLVDPNIASTNDAYSSQVVP